MVVRIKSQLGNKISDGQKGQEQAGVDASAPELFDLLYP